MTRVLIVATTTGYQIRSFGEAAEKLGVRLVFASDRCDQLDDPWWDQAIPIRFHDELGSVQAIVDHFGEHPPDGVIAVGDRPVTIAARVNEAFGLPGNPVSCLCAYDLFAGRGLTGAIEQKLMPDDAELLRGEIVRSQDQTTSFAVTVATSPASAVNS